MHLKTIRHKGLSIKKLLKYMIEGMADKQKDTMIAHNVSSFDMQKMTHQFLLNDSYRRFPAQVRWYHEVLSFSPLDKELITQEMLDDIAQKYIDLRNPNALCFSVAHTNKENIHLHFCFSGTEYRSKKTLRMDNDTFENLRYDIEMYQVKKYPQLKNSIVYTNKERKRNTAIERDKNTRKEKEYQAKRRLGKKQTEKERLSGILQEAYNTSRSVDEFHTNIKKAGLALNYRNGQINGVKANRTYRFATLGINKDRLKELQKLEQRYAHFESMASNNTKEDRER